MAFFTCEAALKSMYTNNSKIEDIISDSSFGNFGRLLFPLEQGCWSGSTPASLNYIWYGHPDADTTVEIINRLKNDADSGRKIFIDLYSEEEKKEDPEKRNTGLFFFHGLPGRETAVCSAGGGFAYVGAMQDSFPHALYLSKQGINAFALIYRPDARKACCDLARAIAYLHEHAEELQISMKGYSLWGGSAGARMAAWLGSFGTEAFIEKEYPRPAAVIMQYTGLNEIYGNEPPTYSCAGTRDYIADYRIMQARTNAIRHNGTDAEIEVFKGLPHGFGLGKGTAAEGWIDHAAAFWKRHISF